MAEPLTTAIVTKIVVSNGAKMGEALYNKLNGTRSSVQADKAIAELSAELAAERERDLEAAAIGKQIADIHQEILDRHAWEGEPETERPRLEDAASAGADLLRQGRRAGSNRKREVLFFAFYMQFAPEFYKTGMGRMLWGIACELEYPTMWALRHIAAYSGALGQRVRTLGQADRSTWARPGAKRPCEWRGFRFWS